MLKRPIILGVLNITEDSFSDGKKYLDPACAIAHAHQLREDGADIIDLGPSASHPGALEVSPEIEIERLHPIVDALISTEIPFSIDSFYPKTQQYALSRHANMINDIQGFSHPEFYPQLAGHHCKLVVMHSVQECSIANLVSTDPDSILDRVEKFFHDRVSALTDAGIASERLILDPGMGFFLGMNFEPSIEILRHLPRLRQRLNFPILISVSRKSFIRHITRRTAQEAGPATLATEIYATLQGVDYIRTHDVKALHDAIEILHYLV